MYFPFRYVGIFFFAAEVYMLLKAVFGEKQKPTQALVVWDPKNPAIRYTDDPEARRLYDNLCAYYDELRRDKRTDDLDWYTNLPVFKALDDAVRDKMRNDIKYESLEEMAFAQIKNQDMRVAYRSRYQTVC